jgi:glycosyltransferase involved in cell wall biosynthesis
LQITMLAPGRGLTGDIKVIGEYAGRLQARGHDVTILYQRTVSDFRRLLDTVLFRRRPDALDESGCRLTAVLEFTEETVPDGHVIIAMGMGPILAASKLPPRKGRLFVLLQAVAAMEESPELARQALAAAPRRVAVSDFVAHFVKTTLDLDSVTISNGVDHAKFHNTDRRFRMPRSVGMISMPGQRKGAAEGFEAMRRVRERWPDVRLVLFGPRKLGGSPPRCEVYVSPKASRLRAIYSSCEIWLAPSHREGFGLPVLEAMSCRVVPVATRAGGHECLIEDGVSGFLVPVGDAEAMAARISLLIEDESILRKMSDAAHERSMAFDWDKSAEKLEGLVRDWR